MSLIVVLTLWGSIMGHAAIAAPVEPAAVSTELRVFREQGDDAQPVVDVRREMQPASLGQTPAGVYLSRADLQVLVADAVRSVYQQNPPSTHRIVHPVGSPVGNVTPVTLRDCLIWLEPQSDWAKKSRDDYHRIVDRWETHHGGPGPDVRDIEDGDYATFATATGITRVAYGLYFDTLLRSQTRRSTKVPYGRPAKDVVLEAVPYRGKVTTAKRDRQTATESLSQPLDETSVSALMDHWPTWWPLTDSELLTPQDFGQIALGIFWFWGPRKCDGFLLSHKCINIEQRVLCYAETKAGNIGAVPIPSVMLAPLWLAKRDAERAGREQLLPFIPRQIRENASDSLYARAREMYQRASVTPIKKGRETKWFHGFRASCSTKWLDLAPKYRERMTLHAGKSVVEIHYTLVSNEMRAAIESYPVPAAMRRLSERIQREHPDCPRA